jgi:putative ABC transport system substrate-binding protein
MTRINRRELIALAGAAWPIAARGQQAGIPIVGFLANGLPDVFAHRLRAFRQGLAEAGYDEGRNVTVEYRWAGDELARLSTLATELASRRVAVIAAFGGINGALAAKSATATIPIVFGIGEDPIATGLAASLSQPGGNITGVVTLGAEVAPKRIEIINEVVPAGTMALLVNPTRPTADALLTTMRGAAQTLGRRVHIFHASNEREIDVAFVSMAEFRVSSLVIGNDAFFNGRAEQFGALTLRYKLPTIYQNRDFVEAGVLMTYGSAIADTYRSVAIYVGRILKGEKPADLPVQQATKVELIINMKTAKSLGLTIPLPLLGRADEVIE